MTLQITTQRPVMVTGATGFVAGWIVKGLLDAGLTVHAAVRDPNDLAKTRHLRQLAERSNGTIKFCKADLLKEGSYKEAMQDCEIIFHTASPFVTAVKDPQKELVDPALLGTRNVLEEAKLSPTIKRVVLTSSCAAIYGDAIDVHNAGGMLTEEMWNTTSSLKHNPYSYSKTLAEREAWRIASTQNQWSLVSINPSIVLGPALNPNATSESFQLVKQMGDGTLKMGAPRWGMGAVDVRDVAKAHLAAAFTPNAKGRYIVSGHSSDMLGIAMTLLPHFGATYPIPRRSTPKWLMWLVAPFAGGGITRRMVSLNVGYAWDANNTRSRRELGVSYRPLAETMKEMFIQLLDSGLVRKRA
jgi:nucleoside-diphosphate-sugar epimerase